MTTGNSQIKEANDLKMNEEPIEELEVEKNAKEPNGRPKKKGQPGRPPNKKSKGGRKKKEQGPFTQ